jgi:hypothetical protein
MSLCTTKEKDNAALMSFLERTKGNKDTVPSSGTRSLNHNRLIKAHILFDLGSDAPPCLSSRIPTPSLQEYPQYPRLTKLTMSQSSSTPRPTPSKYAPIGAYGIGFVEGPTGHLHKAAGQVLTILHCTRLIEVSPQTLSAASEFKPAGLAHLNLVSKTRAGDGAYILPKGDVDTVGECSFGYWTDDGGAFSSGMGGLCACGESLV